MARSAKQSHTIDYRKPRAAGPSSAGESQPPQHPPTADADLKERKIKEPRPSVAHFSPLKREVTAPLQKRPSTHLEA